MRLLRGLFAAVIPALLLGAGYATRSVAAQYSVTDLASHGPADLSFYFTKPWVSINNNGQIAVCGQPTIFGPWSALYFSSGQTTLLAPSDFKAFGLDSSGNIVGGVTTDSSGIYSSVAVWHPDGTTTTLGQTDVGDPHYPIASSAAFAANDQGQIVGGSDPIGYDLGSIIGGVRPWAYNRPGHAFLYDQGVFHDLGTLGGNYSLAYEINNSGRIVGMSTTSTDVGVPAVFHAAYSDGGTLQDLNSLVGPSDWTLKSATDINDAGQITGWGTIDGQTRAYLYDGGSVQALDVLPGYDVSVGRGINAAGDVVGYSTTGEITDPVSATDEPFFWYLATYGEDRAFLYRDGVMHDLNSLIDPTSGWTIRGATDINDSGQIVGWGTLAGEDPLKVHALLLTPVPEPSGWLLAGLGALAIAAWHAMRRRDP